MTSAVLGDGGIYTSLNDMQKWDKSLNDRSLLNEEQLKASWTKGTLTDGSVFEYGYGWHLTEYRGKRLDYHTGSTCGFSNVYMRFPEENLSIVVLINIRDYPAYELGQKVADLFIN
jgi:CubicO group peptidase (beta-lactamase class C family)